VCVDDDDDDDVVFDDDVAHVVLVVVVCGCSVGCKCNAKKSANCVIWLIPEPQTKISCQ
jgi:hypothetical protein